VANKNDNLIPEDITHPTKSPLLSIARYLLAVPKSTIKHGYPYLTFAPTESQTKSAPNSLGLSIFICKPDLTFCPTS
jgi:hypothetical protein